jgi:hypothetical protein
MKRTLQNKNKRNKTKRVRKVGGNPSELADAHPIKIEGDKLYVKLNNAYFADVYSKRYKGENPVYIYNLLDFNIDDDGKLYRAHANDVKEYYGEIDENNKFVLDKNHTLIDRYENQIHIDNTATHTQTMSISNVKVKPGNRTKEGVFKPAFTLQYGKTYETPLTLLQNAELNTRQGATIHNQAKYIIFERKTKKMYTNYAFVRVVMPNRAAPFEGGYLEFEKVDYRRRELHQELLPAVAAMPFEMEGAEVGKEYREVRDDYYEKNPSAPRASQLRLTPPRQQGTLVSEQIITRTYSPTKK